MKLLLGLNIFISILNVCLSIYFGEESGGWVCSTLGWIVAYLNLED